MIRGIHTIVAGEENFGIGRAKIAAGDDHIALPSWRGFLFSPPSWQFFLSRPTVWVPGVFNDAAPEDAHEQRRSSIQVVELELGDDGLPTCDRNAPARMRLVAPVANR